MPKYIFNYRPQIHDFIYMFIFLVGISIFSLKSTPIILILVLLLIIFTFYFVLSNKPSIYFFEEIVELHRGIKLKRIETIKYSDILYIKYVFAQIRGSNLFIIQFNDNGKVRKIQYSFLGRPSKNEISLINRKNIRLDVVPESMEENIK